MPAFVVLDAEVVVAHDLRRRAEEPVGHHLSLRIGKERARGVEAAQQRNQPHGLVQRLGVGARQVRAPPSLLVNRPPALVVVQLIGSVSLRIAEQIRLGLFAVRALPRQRKGQPQRLDDVLRTAMATAGVDAVVLDARMGRAACGTDVTARREGRERLRAVRAEVDVMPAGPFTVRDLRRLRQETVGARLEPLPPRAPAVIFRHAQTRRLQTGFRELHERTLARLRHQLGGGRLPSCRRAGGQQGHKAYAHGLPQQTRHRSPSLFSESGWRIRVRRLSARRSATCRRP